MQLLSSYLDLVILEGSKPTVPIAMGTILGGASTDCIGGHFGQRGQTS